MDALIKYLVQNAAALQFGTRGMGMHRDEADYELGNINQALNEALKLKAQAATAQGLPGQSASYTQMYFNELQSNPRNVAHEFMLERVIQEQQFLSDFQLRLLAKVFVEQWLGLVRYKAFAVGVCNDANMSVNLSFVDYIVSEVLMSYPNDRSAQIGIMRTVADLSCDSVGLQAGMSSGLKHLTRLIEIANNNGWKEIDAQVAKRLLDIMGMIKP